MARFGELHSTGWFELKSDRGLLFCAIITRLFAERDLLEPVLHQAIALLHRAQAEDVDLRTCACNRSGHAILVLCAFLSPEIPAAAGVVAAARSVENPAVMTTAAAATSGGAAPQRGQLLPPGSC